MRPAFRVLADGADVTAAIADRLLDLSVTDEEGVESDQVSIRVDDRHHRVRLPRRGALLSVALGYAETGLADMGLFVVDEVTAEGPPWEVGIAARAADLREDFKEQKDRHFEGETLGSIFGRIASDHGLAAAVDPAIAGRTVDYVAQTAESDLHFMTRLARRHDAVAKPAGGRLVVVRRGGGASGSGLTLAPQLLTPGAVTTVRVSLRDRPHHGSVAATWHDRETAEREEVVIGEGAPRMRLPHPFPSREEAERGAEARARELGRAEGSLSVTMPGRPSIKAEAPVSMAGFRDGIDGNWTVTRAEHRLDGKGYQTSFEAEKGG